ncbi:cytochrome P450 [Daldinia vernicosa]|uniref:cytochrome P450 n=1 Tax=Daldinia vernicosa TaxID=114800 RepID=UPI0020087CB5|nr:cytochrome P450 [Daldinia vernicosa]KAI0849530.1 cytochrome P450 [Daldinia vernicosa]
MPWALLSTMAHLLIFPPFIVVAAYLVYLVYRYSIRNDAPRLLPPGPKSLPILGSIMDLPEKAQPEFQHWLKHREQYGPISSMTVLGRTFIILHDRQAAHDILQKESAKSSDRPWAEFAFSLCGLSEFMVSRYDADFRHRRKLFHQQLGTAKLAARFDDVQEVETRRFLLCVLNNPDATIKHLKYAMGSIILKMTYGYSVEPDGVDPLVNLIEQMTANLVKATVPWLVDFIPALKHLPDGFPGSGFKETARKWKKINQTVVNVPYMFVRRQIAAGNCRQSYVSRLIEECKNGETDSKLRGDDEAAIKRTAAAMYAGGADTTVTAVTSFILAMVKFPEVQREAQEAIDLLIGSDRLPNLADRAKLPYVEALVKEVFRWSPIAPLGIPHAMSEDTAYGGYLIPKGAVLVPMIWWFLHDPNVYAKPDLFNPQRFLEPQNEPDPKTILFGYGRRICPGRFFADANVFVLVAQILAAFNIRKAVDEHGNEIEPTLELHPGLHSHLREFPYKIEVRSPKHASLVRLIEVEQPRREGDSNLLDNDAIKECLGHQG